jgi:hypothetical protein
MFLEKKNQKEAILEVGEENQLEKRNIEVKKENQ